MNDSAFKMLHTLDGRPSNQIDYPWSYDPLFMTEYQDGTGFKPAYQRDLGKNEDSDHSDYILKNLYGDLRITQELSKEKKGDTYEALKLAV